MGQLALRILLVEDDPADEQLVRELLRDASTGSAVEHASGLREAIPMLDRDEFDVVLLDLSLPDAHGLTTVTRVKDAAPHIPIVVLSKREDEELAIEAVQIGAQDYIIKGTAEENALIRAIRYAIERKRAEDRLARLAQYDPLTGLANRILFWDRLAQAMARADRADRLLALLFMDLDGFKEVNDSLGHDAGDALLRQIAQRLDRAVRQVDTVARLGGDEFTVILEALEDRAHATTVAEKIVGTLSQPLEVSGREVAVSASIGIAFYPDGTDDPETLVREADAAMYEAKRAGKNQFRLHSDLTAGSAR